MDVAAGGERTPDRQEILGRIRSLHAAGEPLNIFAVRRRHPELLAGVCAVRPYWGWKQALADAGIRYEDIRVELLPEVECRLCGFRGSNLSAHLRFKHGLTPKAYRAKFPGAEIRSEAEHAEPLRRSKHHLLPHWEPAYSIEYMMDRVAEYQRQGYPLNISWICEHDHNLWQQLHRLGIRWGEFLERMGIDYRSVKQGKPLREVDPAEALAGLRAEAVGGVAPRPAALKRSGKERLVRLAEVHFGSYAAAVEKAGLELAPLRPPARRRAPAARREMTREDALARLREYHAAGRPLRRRHLAVEDRPLLRALRRHFGGFVPALKAAGISIEPAQRGRYASREAVVQALQARHAAGLSLQASAVARGEHADGPLLRAGRKLFGSWAEARGAAGLAPPPARQAASRKAAAPTAEDVLGLLRARADQEGSLALYEISQRLRLLCGEFFGGVEPALAAAGLRLRKRAEAPRFPDREAVLAGLRAHYAGFAFQPGEVPRRSHPPALHPKLNAAWRRYFGSWPEALHAAGVIPEQPVPHGRAAASARPRGSARTREAVVAALQKLKAEGVRLSPTILKEKGHAWVYQAARHVFGDYKQALQAAGIDPDDALLPRGMAAWRVRPPKPRPEDEWETEAWEEDLPAGSTEAEEPAFEEQPPLEGPYRTSEDVLAAIKQRHKTGRSLKYGKICLGPASERDPDLYHAAIHHFGSWKQALRFAGLWY